MKEIIIYTDGASRGNPGLAAAGAVIFEGESNLAEISVFLGEQTNNWAEYEAVALALEKIFELGLQEATIEIRMDSKLVAEQLSGNWKIKKDTLQKQYDKIQVILERGVKNVTYTHVRRELNTHADALANKALDAL